MTAPSTTRYRPLPADRASDEVERDHEIDPDPETVEIAGDRAGTASTCADRPRPVASTR